MTTPRTESGGTGLLPGMPELQAFDPDLPARLKAGLDEAEEKAWDSLARYKFQMLGFWWDCPGRRPVIFAPV